MGLSSSVLVRLRFSSTRWPPLLTPRVDWQDDDMDAGGGQTSAGAFSQEELVRTLCC